MLNVHTKLYQQCCVGLFAWQHCYQYITAFYITITTTLHHTYTTLRGRGQREKCTLNVVKYTFQVKCTLLTTKSALTVQ